MPGKPFYPDLVEELLKEDNSKEGPALRENVLKSLQIPDSKPKVDTPPVSFKTILVEGLLSISSAAAAFAEIIPKLDENENLLENRRKTLWEKVQQILRQMFNKAPEPIVYDVEYIDSIKGVTVKEKINFTNFRIDIDKKTKNLVSISRNGMSKLETLQDERLTALLEKNIRDVQYLHKALSALDDFFKLTVDKEDRDKVKGIKPELAVIKNIIIKANQKRHEYSAQKEEEEQLKRLGISTTI
jgi:hypothetical protein